MDFDIITVKNAIEIARQGSSALDAAIGVAKTLKQLVQSPEPLPVNLVDETIEELHLQILAAQEENVVLRKAIIQLERENIDLKRRQEKFSGYELWDTPVGDLVYRSGEGIEPIHYLCPNCHDAGIKTVLPGNDKAKTCRAASNHGNFNFSARPVPRTWKPRNKRR
ncbi:MAG: hypothetical protein COB16_14365 [Rhodobacteraceae bacterium]|nr:MAG: hypothetical protein COB16_14365 [Paracoccaceae bacterium]